MDTIYFILCIISVFMLAIWSIRKQDKKSKFWWPFEMENDEIESTKKRDSYKNNR